MGFHLEQERFECDDQILPAYWRPGIHQIFRGLCYGAFAASQRAPTAEELFARGPHDATFQFIIGDSIYMMDNNPSHRTTLRRFSV